MNSYGTGVASFGGLYLNNTREYFILILFFEKMWVLVENQLSPPTIDYRSESGVLS